MRNLEILELEIKDYRQYKGKVAIELETNGDNHINIIEGQNGAGKSNILNAITLCFYGEEKHSQSGEEDELDSLPMVNSKIVENMSVNETAEGYVEITMGEDEPEYIFKRRFQTAKLPEGDTNDRVFDLEIQRKAGRDWKPVDQTHTTLNKILPAHVQDYFLFDGEALDEFFEEGYTDRVRDAIIDVSHIELLNNSINHLENVESDLQSNVSELGGKAEKAQKKYKEAESELERLENEKSEKEGNINGARGELEEVKQKMQDSKDPEVQRKIQRRQDREDSLEEKREQIEDKKEEARKYLVRSGSIVYNDDALEDTHELFSDLAEKGQLPPKIQEWFINELIQKKECICGRELPGDSGHTEHLRELQDEMSSIMEENIEGKAEIPHIRTKGQEDLDELLDAQRKIHEFEQKTEDIETELNDIAEKLKQYDIPENVDIPKLEKQRGEIRDRIQELNKKIGKLEGAIERQEKVCSEKEKAYKKELKKEGKESELREKITFASSCLSNIKEVKQEILEEIRQDMEENLNKYFNELIWKDEEYTIELEDDYSVKVVGSSGNNKIGSLSAGEQQVLALSFMSALTRISGFRAPIIIDTPLGRISSEPKQLIAQNLPDYLEETQITFLMTDEEYNEDVQTHMDHSVEHEYMLDYGNDITEVRAR